MCQCLNVECHFVNGCYKRPEKNTETGIMVFFVLFFVYVLILKFKNYLLYPLFFLFCHITAKITNVSMDATDSRITGFLSLVTQGYSTDLNFIRDTNLEQSYESTGLTKNNIVVGFVGVFVISFFLFVLTYIFKCVRKAVQTSAISENRSQAQYKSLSFNEIEPKSLANLRVEPHEQRKEDSPYLSPVVSRNECSSSCDFGEIENNLQEATLNSQRSSDETTNEQTDPENTQNKVQAHVYVEITDDSIKS